MPIRNMYNSAKLPKVSIFEVNRIRNKATVEVGELDALKYLLAIGCIKEKSRSINSLRSNIRIANLYIWWALVGVLGAKLPKTLGIFHFKVPQEP